MQQQTTRLGKVVWENTWSCLKPTCFRSLDQVQTLQAWESGWPEHRAARWAGWKHLTAQLSCPVTVLCKSPGPANPPWEEERLWRKDKWRTHHQIRLLINIIKAEGLGNVAQQNTSISEFRNISTACQACMDTTKIWAHPNTLWQKERW